MQASNNSGIRNPQAKAFSPLFLRLCSCFLALPRVPPIAMWPEKPHPQGLQREHGLTSPDAGLDGLHETEALGSGFSPSSAEDTAELSPWWDGGDGTLETQGFHPMQINITHSPL